MALNVLVSEEVVEVNVDVFFVRLTLKVRKSRSDVTVNLVKTRLQPRLGAGKGVLRTEVVIGVHLLHTVLRIHRSNI